MFIRTYVYSNDKINARKIVEEFLNVIKKEIKTKKYIKNEIYWKDNNMYIIEVEIDFYNNLDKRKLGYFLKDISDKWIVFGRPIDEFLTSQKIEKSNLSSKVNMINIFC
ncbi:MAG: hypothetical protein RSF37_07730 [Clostridium sp.]|uniref:hypothetical protein n=1 Tax=Clostridium sp. TaxID=1506 RepID=UPI002FC91F61